MAKRTGRRTVKRKVKPASPRQPTLPNIVAGAIEAGAQVGRAAWKTAQDLLAAAGRLTANPPVGAGTVNVPQPPVARDALPEGKLDAIAGASRQKGPEPTARRIPATRKPLSRTPARTGESTVKAARRKVR